MESFMDDLLNFSVPEEEDDEEEYMLPLRNLTHRETGQPYNTDDSGVVEEEELEWISNKDAFPVIETFVGVFPPEHFHTMSSERESTVVKQLSPVSVLQTSSNSSTTTTTTSNSSGGSNGSTAVAPTTTATISCCLGLKVPGKARSKRRRTGRRDLRVLWTENEGGIQKKKKKKTPSVAAAMVIIGRKCQHCGAEKTPQWRAGPSGPKTLCNACGVRYKSGRLVPEYRPANSPTFTAELHSNSHRKIIEMRKQFQSGDGDGDRKDCG